MLKMTNGKEISKPINSNCNFVDVFVCIGNKEFDLEKLKEKVFSSTGENIQTTSKIFLHQGMAMY